MKKKSKIIAIVIASVLIYEVAGACLPFAFTKKGNKDRAEEIERKGYSKILLLLEFWISFYISKFIFFLSLFPCHLY